MGKRDKFAHSLTAAKVLLYNAAIMDTFVGIAVADGTGIGTAFFIPEQVNRVIPQKKGAEDAAAGWLRFMAAKQAVAESIAADLAALPKDAQSNAIQREIFETYFLMLEDAVFLKEVQRSFEESADSIELTIQTKAKEYAARLRAAGNEYLAERAQDITDVFDKVLDQMLGIVSFDIHSVPSGSVIFAKTLSPTDTIVLSEKNIAGLALEEGGRSSHVVILARNYGIPAIVGIRAADARAKIQNGAPVIVDAQAAKVIASPDQQTAERYAARLEQERQERAHLKTYLEKPARTKDGTEFTLYANIGTPEEAELAYAEGADGIGLFRTEFLYMSLAENANAHDGAFAEDAQFEAYKRVLLAMKDKPVTIRTLDAGGDKVIDSAEIPMPDEKNPLMGLRAIRLSLSYPALFKTQLRALYRASVYGTLKIMLPLITTAEQVEQSLALIAEVKNELRANNIPFDADVPVGIMVETAAAAIASDCLAKLSAFFSIGTNDLVQYALGVDRENLNVSALYDEYNLSVLRLINMTIRSAAQNKIPLSVCGEMAGRRESILILGGMGVRALSMSPKLISGTKKLLSQFTIAELQAISSAELNMF